MTLIKKGYKFALVLPTPLHLAIFLGPVIIIFQINNFKKKIMIGYEFNQNYYFCYIIVSLQFNNEFLYIRKPNQKSI